MELPVDHQRNSQNCQRFRKSRLRQPLKKRKNTLTSHTALDTPEQSTSDPICKYVTGKTSFLNKTNEAQVWSLSFLFHHMLYRRRFNNTRCCWSHCVDGHKVLLLLGRVRTYMAFSHELYTVRTLKYGLGLSADPKVRRKTSKDAKV